MINSGNSLFSCFTFICFDIWDFFQLHVLSFQIQILGFFFTVSYIFLPFQIFFQFQILLSQFQSFDPDLVWGMWHQLRGAWHHDRQLNQKATDLPLSCCLQGT